MQTRPRRERPERYVPQTTTPRPRYSNAAAAAAASQASDGYKPREERSWDEFHPELDLAATLLVFPADEVDGRSSKNDPKLQKIKVRGARSESTEGDVDMKDPQSEDGQPGSSRRKTGRAVRRPESMLSGLGSPPAPRIMPLPTHNPRERLNLPKPSYRQYNHFLQYEEDLKENKVNYVDRTMAHVGYQESDRFELPPKVLLRLSESQHVEDEADVSLRLESDGPAELGQGPPAVGRVEYDMDEQDVAWLEDINEQRRSEGIEAIKPAIFEITLTQIEKEYHALEKRIPKPQPRHPQTHRPRSSSQAAVNGDPNPPGDEPDSKCSICDDGDCENANAIIFCDGCDLAVHQECYGVPFIPEGQWFCRKCKEIGRGTPTCIFCPNVDGAFKQTSTLRWSHLLCAIWIPEVTIANMTFMEPIQDVDKVPKSRWKLSCYICNQKMGACIQCGNKNCYQAFHVTCARRARLFLKMKSQNQGAIDTAALKAFCDKHVPQEWRRVNDTDRAIVEAKRWYKHAMKDRKWADSQSAALELGAPPPPDGGVLVDHGGADDTIVVSKRRNKKDQRSTWRLPSGAPVVPNVVYNTVEASLARFTVRRRKEFVEKACRYWTLKREARRGAALLKRLQLQLEGFSSMEVTRRNFAGMGSAGGPRLQRRIDFAEMLRTDMKYLTELSTNVRLREELRLKEVEMLRELVDTVYFPIPPLLWPILHKAQK
jgi:NuA3 HAT complex component NTO1